MITEQFDLHPLEFKQHEEVYMNLRLLKKEILIVEDLLKKSAGRQKDGDQGEDDDLLDIFYLLVDNIRMNIIVEVDSEQVMDLDIVVYQL